MVKPIVKKGVEFLTDTLGNKIGALPSANELRKDATIRIDNPQFLDAITGETYVQKKIRENKEYIEDLVKNYGKRRDEITIGSASGVTGYVDNIKFTPNELINIRGAAGEEKYRILIHVREDGVPFITEGNHRVAEAYLSNRPFINADIRYLRGSENVDGPLNPRRIGIDFGDT